MNAHRFPLPVSHSRAPYSVARSTAVLVALVIYAAGLFTGAMVFGHVLVAHQEQLNAGTP